MYYRALVSRTKALGILFLAFCCNSLEAQQTKTTNWSDPSSLGPLPLHDAVTLINVFSPLQLNLEVFGTNDIGSVKIDATSWRVLTPTSIHRMISGLTNYSLVQKEHHSLTLADNRGLAKSMDPLNFRIENFSATNLAMFKVFHSICKQAPFNLEFHRPLLIDKNIEPKLAEDEQYWTKSEMRHAVSLEVRTRTVREIVSEIVTPHYKAYTISEVVILPESTNVFISIYRPTESLENGILRKILERNRQPGGQ